MLVCNLCCNLSNKKKLFVVRDEIELLLFGLILFGCFSNAEVLAENFLESADSAYQCCDKLNHKHCRPYFPFDPTHSWDSCEIQNVTF